MKLNKEAFEAAVPVWESETGKRRENFCRVVIQTYLSHLPKPDNALERQEVVRVKPLVWDGYFAHTNIPMYHLAPSIDHLDPSGDGVILEKINGSTTMKSFWNNASEAKSAAQEDYEQRILSAIEPTPAAKDLRALKTNGDD